MPRRGIGLLAVVLCTAGCGSKQDALDPHSKAARGIESLWWNMLIGSALAFGILAVYLLVGYARRRRAGFPGAADADRAGWLVVLGLGIAVPVVALSGLFLFANIVLVRDTALSSAAASDRAALTIRVVAHQFWWEVRYPGTNAVTANEIHIPVRTNVELLLSTRDVIHSFWVPQLNKKIDMLPEQTNRLLLYADEPGRYRGQCAEFCGLQHAHMGLYVFAEPRDRFRAWLARESAPARASSPLFDEKCGSCHAIRGTGADGNTGPDLTHVGSRASLAAVTIPNTRERMREWVLDPQRVKPGNSMPAVALSAAELQRLVEYLEARR
jgi:cytochrome c oxidase subunit II